MLAETSMCPEALANVLTEIQLLLLVTCIYLWSWDMLWFTWNKSINEWHFLKLVVNESLPSRDIGLIRSASFQQNVSRSCLYVCYWRWAQDVFNICIIIIKKHPLVSLCLFPTSVIHSLLRRSKEKSY